MEKIVINRSGVDELVEYPNEEAEQAFLSKNVESEKKHICKNNLVRVKNEFLLNGDEVIDVLLDCHCSKDKYETVVTFYDSSLIKAKDNFKGWLSNVAPYFIQNDYQIIDERKYNYES